MIVLGKPTVADSRGNYALHHACLSENLEIISYILEQSSHGASVRNSDGKLPIQLLLYDASYCRNGLEYLYRNGLEYMGAIHCMVCAYPNVRDIAL